LSIKVLVKWWESVCVLGELVEKWCVLESISVYIVMHWIGIEYMINVSYTLYVLCTST
jgi:hypothetical protein